MKRIREEEEEEEEEKKEEEEAQKGYLVPLTVYTID